MAILDLRRRLVAILEADPDCTDSQLLETTRARMKERRTYKQLYEQRPAHTATWNEIRLGQMVVAERGPDSGLAVWMIAGRQEQDSVTVKLLFVRIIDPTENPEIMWLTKSKKDTVTVLDLPGVGDGTAALGELQP